ncbi:hypothetical protein BS414_14020 [Cronobacter sakazakii]|nr:hypothetical protein CDT91_04850 [Cronobacter sakazakii]PQY52665.1 hypothetical protein C5945_03620 [Cronobacter sakazakii]PUX29432.1 hypothetical protein BS410_02730 [Cronobacter sakazakii]PUX43912.1 hypothetical protein BS424_17165 [Cronobacter sakazakii]PUX68767.1 hypothetical protein BS414_14020 [Cronobacter sakazakii]
MIINSYRCRNSRGDYYLFLWLNNFGVKFLAYYGCQYEEAKQFFINSRRDRLEEQPVTISGIVEANEEIVSIIERFSL